MAGSEVDGGRCTVDEAHTGESVPSGGKIGRVFGRTLFSGSRFLFWSLAPFLIGFAVVLAMFVSDWATRGGLLVAVLDAAALLLLLQLYDRVRFHWAGRVLAALVCLAYVAYFIEKLATEGIRLPRSRGDATAVNAFIGLVIIGLPAGLYAFLGRWTLRDRTG
jgi:hypothetical protein